MQRSDVMFESAGTRCAAWLYQPAESEPRPTPCIVMAHGFSAVRDQRLAAFAERFVQAGLTALVFDYRHFGDSDGVPRQLLDIGRQLDDWRSAIAYARTLEGVDRAQVALWGTSFSAGHVITLAARDASLAAVIAQAPFVDGLITLPALGATNLLRLTLEGLRDQLAAVRGRPPHLIGVVGPRGSKTLINAPGAELGFGAITSPDSTWRNEVAARIALHVGIYRPTRHAGRIRCPILFCVADRDNITAPELAIQAAAKAPRAEVRRYPIAHFEIYTGDWFDRAVTDQVDFLARHLLRGDAPVPAAAARQRV